MEEINLLYLVNLKIRILANKFHNKRYYRCYLHIINNSCNFFLTKATSLNDLFHLSLFLVENQLESG